MARISPDTARSALADRLRAAGAVLAPALDVPPSVDPARDGALLLDALVAEVHANLSMDRLWLLFVAVSTAFPTQDEILDLRRRFELGDPVAAAMSLLEAGMKAARKYGQPDATIRIVSDEAVIDVDFAAQHELHTGIQRVVRSTAPLWESGRPVVFAAWTPGHGAYRELRPAEVSRVVDWGDERRRNAAAKGPKTDPPPATIVVPWRTAVVLGEVPSLGACSRLASLALHSGNKLTAIGYDCIPIVSADLLPEAEPNRFVKYLALLKYAHGIAGISVSATEEFAGFASMLSAQGLRGPAVFECALPSPAASDTSAVRPAARPQIMCVGSFEPRKNQSGVLHAAELLWRSGLDFELVFIGGGGIGNEVRALVNRLAKRGRPVSARTGVSEAELENLYRTSRFTVFASLHEGYGLPVAESIAHGTPVLTTNYGSTAEIAEEGGALVVNPRDDRDLTDAMRRMLTDDDLIASLRRQIATRPHRGWQEYADELWKGLVEPALADARSGVTTRTATAS